MAAFRQKTIHCGMGNRTKFREVGIYPLFPPQQGKRGRKSKESRPAQERLNEKYSIKHLRQLVKSNFFNTDYHVTLTYNDENLPEDEKEADRLVTNFLNKVKRAREKLGLPPLKYIWVNENFDGTGRPHHHILMNGGLDRDRIEAMWSIGKGRKARKIGLTTVDLLQFDNSGNVEALIKYITKQTLKDNEEKSGATEGQLNLSEVCGGDVTEDDLMGDGRLKGRKRWKASKNLTQPHERTRENAIKRKEYRQLADFPEDCEDIRNFWEKRNPGYILDTFKRRLNAVTGLWSFYATMHRRD